MGCLARVIKAIDDFAEEQRGLAKEVARDSESAKVLDRRIQQLDAARDILTSSMNADYIVDGKVCTESPCPHPKPK